MDITGRKLFVKALQEEGVDTIFGYPGKYLPCARRLQCRQRECGQIRRHPAFYRDTELR